MSHLNCPATAWRNAPLRVAPVDDLGHSVGTGGYRVFAGTFADENAGQVATSSVRQVAEGRWPQGLTIGGGASPAYSVTLDLPADATVSQGMSMASAPSSREPSRPTGQAIMERETAAAAAEQYDRLVVVAEDQERTAAKELESRLDEVEDLRSTLRGLRTRVAELRTTRNQLLGSIGVEA